jgi:hypothetical protein
MSIPGSYLVLEVDEEIIAETTDVSLKIVSKALDTTSKDSGLNAEYIGGKVMIAIAGGYLLASSGANWEALFDYMHGGTSMTVEFYRDGVYFFNGAGYLKKLSLTGANSDSLTTGVYGISFIYDAEETEGAIITEDGLEITTEDGETILIE